MHLVTVGIDQLEALQDHADRERRLVHRKAAADAGALAVAERLPGVDRTRRLSLASEIIGIERVGAREKNIVVGEIERARVTVVRVMPRQVTDAFGLKIQFHGVAKGFRKEENLLPVMRPVSALPKPRDLRNMWRQVIGRIFAGAGLGGRSNR